MNVRLSRIAYGLATYLPGVYRHFSMPPLSVAEMAIDGYSKWLHHMCAVAEGSFIEPPEAVAEIGPGPACPAGIAALVAGCKRYYALDVVKHAEQPAMLSVFDEVCRLFARKTALRDWQGILPARPFPVSLFPDSRLGELLSPSRLEELKRDIGNPAADGAMQVMIPWHQRSVIKEGSLDMVFSTAAMEHVDDLETAYRAMNLWVRPSGVVCHVIDYGCHEACNEWNGHWVCSDTLWRVLKGNRPYFINRRPHSLHVALLEGNGFRVLSERFVRKDSRFERTDLSPRLRDSLTEADLITNYCFLLARKIYSVAGGA